MRLETRPNLAWPDEFYQALVEAHAGLDDAACSALDVRLILLLANHVGDPAVLREALALAREDAAVAAAMNRPPDPAGDAGPGAPS